MVGDMGYVKNMQESYIQWIVWVVYINVYIYAYMIVEDRYFDSQIWL